MTCMVCHGDQKILLQPGEGERGPREPPVAGTSARRAGRRSGGPREPSPRPPDHPEHPLTAFPTS